MEFFRRVFGGPKPNGGQSQHWPDRGTLDTRPSSARSGRSRPTQDDSESQLRRPSTAAQPHPPQTINVILFGEAGVGKSAVVNLIAGSKVANTSSDADACTMQWCKYNVCVDGGATYSIFDTVGFNQGQVLGVNPHLEAIESAYNLITALRAAGGVHLLLFCIRGSRMTMTARNNYRLFAEFLCQGRVPVAVVVTGLEWEPVMEDWWTRNRVEIERKFGIRSVGHACVTTVMDFEEDRIKYWESQWTIREVLKRCSLETGAFMLDITDGLAMAETGLRSLVKEDGKTPSRKDIEKVLSKRLRMPKENVKKILDMMEKNVASAT